MKANFINKSKCITLIFTILFVGYVLLLAYLTFLSKYYGRGLVHRSVNLIPLRSIIEFLTFKYDLRAIITNIAGNIVAFMPMGFLLPIVFKKLNRLEKVVFVALLSSLAIEVVQYISRTGASDIDDIILNVLGAVIGYWIFRLFNYICKI